jgi:hypothetical protein
MLRNLHVSWPGAHPAILFVKELTESVPARVALIQARVTQ